MTKFEGIIIEKVFFSNKNIYGNLMLSTCKQVDVPKSPAPKPTTTGETDVTTENMVDKSSQDQGAENLMIHRLKDLFQLQHENRMINCHKLGVFIPKDFVQSRRFPVSLGYALQVGSLKMPP